MASILGDLLFVVKYLNFVPLNFSSLSIFFIFWLGKDETRLAKPRPNKEKKRKKTKKKQKTNKQKFVLY